MSGYKEIKKILIANRAEIAVRVIKTCRDMGIKTVSIYTDVESDLPHAKVSDEAVCLGSGALSETYLNIEKIIKIAKDHNVDAIHPGYGFLSENTLFENAIREAGLIFIGPSESAIRLMGDKKGSKLALEKTNVPLVPGYHGDAQDEETLRKQADIIGYPLLLKASAGGGGKGMRKIMSADGFSEGFASAKREAKNAFGDDRMIIEKLIINPRHIEVQVMSDSHGNHLHLFERECSIQRRHQKIVEETPSVALNNKLREQICNTAVEISSHINYLGAGTVEFMLDQDGKYYFLEMNTRLQVEHPITEMVTGYDLVRMQIEVASGKKLEIKQSDIFQRGHAIEVRLYAEDPDNEFLPTIGKLEYIGKDYSHSTRLDIGYEDGNNIGIDFDPMLAKLICYGETREQATLKLINALKKHPFLGVKTNREYLLRILKHKEFKSGETFTNFVEIYKDDLQKPKDSDQDLALAIGSLLLNKPDPVKSETVSGNKAWNSLIDFRNV